ncbi:ROK family protein [Pontibacillus marinus]|uniref:ROK family protein n=1 Tax=Pontibacillus marinus TaxID=273164 RepID=UPI0004841E71|nr:ROK family protein [Pontibacillus marinus]
MYLGGIETGGTKVVCGIGTEDGELVERTSFPTTTPNETLNQIFMFFHNKNIKAIGIGSFGPIDLNKESKTFGYIKNTPKPYWSQLNLLGELTKRFPFPVELDTDVNVAALGEMKWGNAKGLDSCIYITVGTGIGVGAVTEGVVLHGMSHSEMGHILVRRHPKDHFKGICPYHRDCLEGLASGPAIEERWGEKGEDLIEYPELLEFESFYLAQAISNYILILSPKKIIIGGGVMKKKKLLPIIRDKVKQNLNDYVQSKELDKLDSYIVSPGLGDNAGLLGAIALAERSC